MDLDSLKYADLRQLAKSVGLKANMKADKLLRALKQHFEKENSENGNDVVSDEVQCPVEAPAQPTPPSNALVTMRRGKNKNGKRKLSEDEASDLNPKLQESAVQDDGKSDEVEGKEVKSSLKRRKVSLIKDMETPVPPEKPKQNQAEMKCGSASKKVGSEKRNKESANKSVGKIPCHEGLMKKKAALRPTTPNFRKLHEAHFNKMESIDSYVQRKNKQMEVLRNSVKELKAQTENPSKPSETQPKRSAKRPSMFSPGIPVRKPDKSRTTPANKSVLKESAPFKPTVLSAHKINVRFSQGTRDNEHKRSMLKTPARMSALLPVTPISGRKSTGPANKTPGIDPFIFSGSGTPATSKKKAFDLKASLSRPLTYKPHKGKLKPFGTTEENAAPEQTQLVPSHQKNYKQHQVQTREERRNKHTKDRKQKKEKMLGARRGVVVA